VEWDNDAEMQIKDLELTEEDSAEDRQNKIRLLQIYNIKLHEREERRKFVIERELHHVKKQQRLEKNRTKEEKELISKVRRFAPLMPIAQYDELVKAVINERSLRQRIAELQDCRSNGCRSLQEAEVYKREVKRREAEKGRWNANKGGTRGKGWDGTATKKLQPGYELLSDIEKEIIAQLKLSPEKYIQAKEAILKEALLTGKVNRADAASITKMGSYSIELRWR
jgi:transcriptional adapter 2-alpha